MLERKRTGLIVIDVQDRLFSLVERQCDVTHSIEQVIRGFQILHLPIVVTEQYPEKMGMTIEALRQVLGQDYKPVGKRTFSCLGEEALQAQILSLPVDQWVLVGIETHVCILQTAKALLRAGKEVVVLNDCITSRSIYDYSTAIAEMRDCGVRISSVETVLFELVQDSRIPEFKEISQLIK
jgi:nicotinamidase-related amidase